MLRAVLAAWREVKIIVIGLLGLTLFAWRQRKPWLPLLSTALLGGVVYFFRDPERTPALSSPAILLAPADGRVTTIERVSDDLIKPGPAQRISIFLSLFDVHVQRSPCNAVVRYLHYRPGKFAPAFLADVQQNEHNIIGLETSGGHVVLKQIAGLIARRIVCWPSPGDELVAGQRLGLIKFGSRVDLLLPGSVEVLVQVGQQVYAGQTVVARW